MREIVALLVNEPWLLRPWEVKRLTLSQIFDLYLWPRDENGKLVFEDRNAGENYDPREWFFRLWRMRRLREDKIAEKWRHYIQASEA